MNRLQINPKARLLGGDSYQGDWITWAHAHTVGSFSRTQSINLVTRIGTLPPKNHNDCWLLPMFPNTLRAKVCMQYYFDIPACALKSTNQKQLAISGFRVHPSCVCAVHEYYHLPATETHPHTTHELITVSSIIRIVTTCMSNIYHV